MEQMYVVYAEGTWKKNRALFWRKNGPARYSAERYADTFTLDEAERISKMNKGNHKWMFYPVVE